jgi:hypothetical protein
MKNLRLHLFIHRSFITIFFGMSLCGCAVTTVQRNHHLLQADSLKVSVGFLRQNRDTYAKHIEISLDGENLLNLAKGQYTFLSLKPGKYEMEITNWTIEPGDTHRFQTSRNFIVDLAWADSMYLLFTPEERNFWKFLGSSISKQMPEKLAEQIDTLTTLNVRLGKNATLVGSTLGSFIYPSQDSKPRYGFGYRVESVSRDSAIVIASRLKPAEGAENSLLHK